jgi:hypothetical protein
MALYTFGTGTLWGVRTDVANSTPVKFGALQDVSVEFSGTNKTLFGQYQYPLAVARGTSKISGKAKFGQISGSAFSNLFFGATPASGQTTAAITEAGTVPGSSTYTIQVTNHSTFTANLGVVYASSGLPLQQVAGGSEALGKYSVSSGTYTFASADASAAVLIDYQYTTTGGQEFTLANPLLGVQPVFQVVLNTQYTAPTGLKKADLTLFNCVSSKFSIDFKQDDFSIPELDFDAFANAAGNVFTWSFSEAS